jgi:polar amino acid transport system substrate-binding protein
MSYGSKSFWPRGFLFLFILSLSFSLHAQPEAPRAQVAVHVCPPFVIEQGEGYTGLSLFLWEAIAEELGVEFDVRPYSLKDMLEAVAAGDADVGVSCLSITSEREKVLDFSHAFYETHRAILVKQRGYLGAVKRFFSSAKVLIGIAIVSGAAFLVGGLFFILEHRINPKLYSLQSWYGKLMEAFIVGLLFVTRGPIRFYEFKTPTARVLSALLAVGSTLLIASITAVLAGAFTLQQLRSDITGPGDLAHVRVGALEASTSSSYLTNIGVKHRTFSDLEQMIDVLDVGKLDAVVSDEAVLKYTVNNGRARGHYGSLTVLPHQLDKQNYAFALPDESPHMEVLDQALLTVRNSAAWRRQLVEYLGE